jgi:hypothetical protein
LRAKTLGCNAAFVLLLAVAPAAASPWVVMGDNQIRSDMELRQAAGVWTASPSNGRCLGNP